MVLLNNDCLSTGNAFNNAVISLQKGGSLKIFMDARQLNPMINDKLKKHNWAIETLQVIQKSIKGLVL